MPQHISVYSRTQLSDQFVNSLWAKIAIDDIHNCHLDTVYYLGHVNHCRQIFIGVGSEGWWWIKTG